MDVSVAHGRLGADAADFIAKSRRLLIDNEWVEARSGKRFAVFDPATSQQIAEVAEADAADVDLAVAAARRAFDGGEWARMKPSARGQLLWRLADLMEAHADELAEIESLDNGKPVTVARAADIPLAIDMFRYMAGMATKVRGSTLNLSSPGDYHRQRELAALERQQDAILAAEPACLPAERILYVGGRPGCTEQMRAALDAAGGTTTRPCCPAWSAKPTGWPFPWTA